MPSFSRIGDDYKFSYQNNMLFYGDGSFIQVYENYNSDHMKRTETTLVSFDGRYFKFLTGLSVGLGVDILTNQIIKIPKPKIWAKTTHCRGMIQLNFRTDCKMEAMLVAVRKQWPRAVGSHIASYLPSTEIKAQLLFTYPQKWYHIAAVLYCPRTQVTADRRKKRKVMKRDYDLSRSPVVDKRCGYLGTVKDIIERGIQQERASSIYRLERIGERIDITVCTYSTNGVVVSWSYCILNNCGCDDCEENCNAEIFDLCTGKKQDIFFRDEFWSMIMQDSGDVTGLSGTVVTRL